MLGKRPRRLCRIRRQFKEVTTQKKRRHNRGRWRNQGTRLGNRRYQTINVNFSNMRGLSSKVHDLHRHLISESISIFGVVESFLNYDLDKDYLWIGKCRKGIKTRGVSDFAYLARYQSWTIIYTPVGMNDSFERLWSLVRIYNTKMAIGFLIFLTMVYKRKKTDALYYELLENTENQL